LVDADVLISPRLGDVSGVAMENPGTVSVMQAFSIPRYFPYNYMFDRLPLIDTSDGKTKIGPSANFVITTKYSHFLWNPSVEVPELSDPFRIDEYIMSYNLAKYGLHLHAFGNPTHPDIYHLAATSKPNDGDMKNLLEQKKEWKML
jgi:hypothetical protein